MNDPQWVARAGSTAVSLTDNGSVPTVETPRVVSDKKMSAKFHAAPLVWMHVCQVQRLRTGGIHHMQTILYHKFGSSSLAAFGSPFGQ